MEKAKQPLTIFFINLLLVFYTIIGTPQRMLLIAAVFAVTGVYCLILLKADGYRIKPDIINLYNIWVVVFAALLLIYGVQLKDMDRYAYTYHIASIIYLLMILFMLSKEGERMIDTVCISTTVYAIIRFAYSLRYDWAELVRVRAYDGWIRLGNTDLENVNSAALWYGLFLIPLMYNLFFKKKIACLLGVFICTAGAFFTGSKKSVIIIALLWLFCVIVSAPTWQRAVLSIAVIVVGFIIILPYLHDNYTLWVFIGSRFEDVIAAIKGNAAAGSSTQARSSFASLALSHVGEHPVFGHGWDAFRDDLSTLVTKEPTYSHNNYTELLYDLGIVGFVVYYIAPLVLFIKGVMTKNKNIIALTLMTLMCTLFAEIGAVTVYYTIAVLIFWGIAYIHISNTRQEE